LAGARRVTGRDRQGALDLEEELAEIADVDRVSDGTGMVIVKVTPRNPKALPIIWSTWIFQDSEITLRPGDTAGCGNLRERTMTSRSWSA
jgi:hypothetical protein